MYAYECFPDIPAQESDPFTGKSAAYLDSAAETEVKHVMRD
jgi:hypothetical protein